MRPKQRSSGAAASRFLTKSRLKMKLAKQVRGCRAYDYRARMIMITRSVRTTLPLGPPTGTASAAGGPVLHTMYMRIQRGACVQLGVR